MTRVHGSRILLGDNVPFLLGRYPGRVAPVHVSNGLVSALFGPGPAGKGVQRATATAEKVQDLNCVGESIRQNPEARERFNQALRTIIDPDGRVYEQIGSPFPLHWGIVTNDPSDDGFGQDLADVVSGVDPELIVEIQDMLTDGSDGDALERLGYTLGEAAIPEGTRERSQTNRWQ